MVASPVNYQDTTLVWLHPHFLCLASPLGLVVVQIGTSLFFDMYLFQIVFSLAKHCKVMIFSQHHMQGQGDSTGVFRSETPRLVQGNRCYMLRLSEWHQVIHFHGFEKVFMLMYTSWRLSAARDNVCLVQAGWDPGNPIDWVTKSSSSHHCCSLLGLSMGT